VSATCCLARDAIGGSTYLMSEDAWLAAPDGRVASNLSDLQDAQRVRQGMMQKSGSTSGGVGEENGLPCNGRKPARCGSKP
jgi:hypothetical protein